MTPNTYRHYLIAVLMVVMAFNYVDRLALGVALQSIKADLQLTDTQLGFLGGIAFALFYSIMGVPLGRWADRGNRITIISVTTALWSVAVATCGLARSLAQLLLIRVGVAVGEAGCIPPAHSLIADYFTRAERPRAVAIYMAGGALSVVIGYFLAGWLNELFGWRRMFVYLGLPGLGLALLAWSTLREPRRKLGAARVSSDTPVSHEKTAPSPSLRDVREALWANRTFRHLLWCFAVVYFFGYGIQQWQPAFFMRSHGLRTGELGTWFAMIYGLGGLVGTYLGGEWATRWAANNEAMQLKLLALCYCAFGILSVPIYLVSNRYLAFGLMALTAIVGAAATGPLFATMQTLVPERMRATSIAIVYMVANLIGMGLGPLAVGALSDAFQPRVGDESLRYALIALCPGYLWGGWHLWRACRTVASDLALTIG